jgi:hypothetical protein
LRYWCRVTADAGPNDPLPGHHAKVRRDGYRKG